MTCHVFHAVALLLQDLPVRITGPDDNIDEDIRAAQDLNGLQSLASNIIWVSATKKYQDVTHETIALHRMIASLVELLPEQGVAGPSSSRQSSAIFP